MDTVTIVKRGGGDAGRRGIARPLRAVAASEVLAWPVAAFATLVLVAAVGTEERLPVLLPILVLTGIAAAFCQLVRRRTAGAFPYFEIGVVYVAVVWLYATFPLVGFLVNGLKQGPLNDLRLYIFRPSADEIGSLGWYQVAHLASVAAVYLAWRGRGRLPEPRFPSVDRATLVATVVAYVAIRAYLLFLKVYFDLFAATYMQSYQLVRRLPLEHAQLANHLGGATFILELVILTSLFAGYPRWRLVIAGWLVMAASLGFTQLGNRTELALLMGAVLFMYQRAVRRLQFRHVAACGAICLSGFLLLGFVRAGGTLATLTAGAHPLFGYASEFENNLANAYDVGRLKALGLIRDLPTAFYLADLFALVPQQILPVEKVNPPVWYVNTFYPDYAEGGGAFAFGTIAESVLGGGWIDAGARGAALGLLLAQVHRWYARSDGRLWPFIFYVWATVSAYNSFRGTTFMLVGLAVYRFVPVCIGVGILASVLRAMPRSGGVWTRTRSARVG
jgi:hypothetical protein